MMVYIKLLEDEIERLLNGSNFKISIAAVVLHE
jgi:hypothetical protein